MAAPSFPSRTLPDPDTLTAEYLRALLPDVTVETQESTPWSKTPTVVVRSTTSGTVPHWRFVREAYVDITYFETGSRKACADLAERVRVALFTAWQDQYTLDTGSIASIEVTMAPYEQRLSGQGAEEYRFTSTYRMLLRPPRQPNT